MKNPERFGVVVTNKKGKVLSIKEKPTKPETNIVAVGVYVLDHRIFKYKPTQSPNGEYYLTSMIKKMLKDHAVQAIKTSFWHPIGYPKDLKTAEKILKRKPAHF